MRLFYISPVTKRSAARLTKQKAVQTEASEARGGVACWKEELSFGVTRFFRAVRSCPLIVGRKRSSGDSIVGKSLSGYGAWGDLNVPFTMPSLGNSIARFICS